MEQFMSMQLSRFKQNHLNIKSQLQNVSATLKRAHPPVQSSFLKITSNFCRNATEIYNKKSISTCPLCVVLCLLQAGAIYQRPGSLRAPGRFLAVPRILFLWTRSQMLFLRYVGATLPVLGLQPQVLLSPRIPLKPLLPTSFAAPLSGATTE